MSFPLFVGATLLAFGVAGFFVYDFFYVERTPETNDSMVQLKDLTVEDKSAVVSELNKETSDTEASPKPQLAPPPSDKTTVSPQQADPADPDAAAKIHILDGLNTQ